MPDTCEHDISIQPEILGTRNVDPSVLARLFDEWMQADAAEQRETFQVLRHSLDEDRQVGYKLFS
jgi:hypothetical protein